MLTPPAGSDRTDRTPSEQSDTTAAALTGAGPASGGWGSLRAVGSTLLGQHFPIRAATALAHQNKPSGFACVSCAWAKPGKPHLAEFCENGAKATAWELTNKVFPVERLETTTTAQLQKWSDLDLEDTGRVTEPMKWDADSGCYRRVSWEAAYADIAARLRTIEPDAAVFYASGRASLETSYAYGLLARQFGTNNLPDSSNMCHESTSVALPPMIGVPVGTVRLDDFEHTDAIFILGQNTSTNSPRMLHQLQEARERGVPIVTFNPIIEPGLVRFANPQSPVQMLTGNKTQISTHYYQLRIGGDSAALLGMCKALFASDATPVGAEPLEPGAAGTIDHAFIAEHCAGLAKLAESVHTTSWAQIESASGLTRAQIEEATSVYGRAKAVIGIYGMGLTQHRLGVTNVQMLLNLLLLRGNIGKRGAGICPVRGHSNVQGQRTVGITEKPELVPLDVLQRQYGFEPPRKKGLATVEACKGILDGSVRAFIGLGGNFLRAAPDTDRLERAWRELDLTVHVTTKLNRSHVVHGRHSYVLPCRGRIEIDRRGSGEQTVSVEDSTGVFHASRGVAEPPTGSLRSEMQIVAELAQALLGDSSKVPWQAWSHDYALVRDAIAKTYPDIFKDFNQRLAEPAGFPKTIAAREREWKTPNGKANFVAPEALRADPDIESKTAGDPDVLELMTIRSDDQFNTTIYSLDDRFRNVSGSRRVLMMNREDMQRLGLAEGAIVTARTAVELSVERRVEGLKIMGFNIPKGCAAGYFPECNPLLPLWHHAVGSGVPAGKAIPVRIEAR